MFVVGVDGCRSGWVAVALNNGRFAGATLFEDFDTLHEDVDDAYVIGVDIPIGLVDQGKRTCDALVRETLGPRGSSLFTMPPRPSLEAETYDEANRRCRELMGQGLSKQAYNLRDKIFEVDRVVKREHLERPSLAPKETARELMMKREPREALRKYARIIEPDDERERRLRKARPGGRIIEVHPEASFTQLAGGPLSHSKKSYNGAMTRLRLLERAGINVPIELDEVGGVAIDDVLDAAVVAWTAHRYGMQQAVSVPPKTDWQRDGQRVIAIWT